MNEQFPNPGVIEEGAAELQAESFEQPVEYPYWLTPSQRDFLEYLNPEDRAAQVLEWQQEMNQQALAAEVPTEEPAPQAEDEHGISDEVTELPEATEEAVPTLDDLPQTPLADFSNTIDDIPETGLMGIEDLKNYLDATTDIQELDLNKQTREEAKAMYEAMKQDDEGNGALPGSPRMQLLNQYIAEQDEAIELITARINYLKPKPKWFSPKRWFGRGK